MQAPHPGILSPPLTVLLVDFCLVRHVVAALLVMVTGAAAARDVDGIFVFLLDIQVLVDVVAEVVQLLDDLFLSALRDW